jgi:hypothetical protein
MSTHSIHSTRVFHWLCAAAALACVASSSYWVAGLVQFSRGPAAADSSIVIAGR